MFDKYKLGSKIVIKIDRFRFAACGGCAILGLMKKDLVEQLLLLMIGRYIGRSRFHFIYFISRYFFRFGQTLRAGFYDCTTQITISFASLGARVSAQKKP